MTPTEEKSALRARVRAAMGNLTPGERANASDAACARLNVQPLWRDAQTILLFAPLADELDIWPCVGEALASGKTVFLPRFDTAMNGYVAAQVNEPVRDLARGPFGIREPTPLCRTTPLNRLDLILVPGLAFDRWGRRLGRGKGFYDRWLSRHGGPTCGVAYDEQVVDAIPVEAHDLTVDCILTPSRWIEVSPRRAVPN